MHVILCELSDQAKLQVQPRSVGDLHTAVEGTAHPDVLHDIHHRGEEKRPSLIQIAQKEAFEEGNGVVGGEGK